MPNPHWDTCQHCGQSVHRSARSRHEKTCWAPRTLARLFAIGSVTWETDDCWLWNEQRQGGYGRHKNGRVHRLVLELVAGPPPSDLHEACHTCDVRTCVNPRHLYWGTRSDNMRDMVERGRGGGYLAMTQAEREATLEQARAAQRGKPRSQAWKDSVSAAMSGRPGRVQSEEEKERRRATWRAKRGGHV